MDRQLSLVIIIYRNRILLGRQSNVAHNPQKILDFERPEIKNIISDIAQCLTRHFGSWLSVVFVFKPAETIIKSAEES